MMCACLTIAGPNTEKKQMCNERWFKRTLATINSVLRRNVVSSRPIKGGVLPVRTCLPRL